MGSDPSGSSAKVAMGHTQKTLKCTHIYTKYYYPHSHVTQTASHGLRRHTVTLEPHLYMLKWNDDCNNYTAHRRA